MLGAIGNGMGIGPGQFIEASYWVMDRDDNLYAGDTSKATRARVRRYDCARSVAACSRRVSYSRAGPSNTSFSPSRTVSELRACMLIAVWASRALMTAFMISVFRSDEFANCSLVLYRDYASGRDTAIVDRDGNRTQHSPLAKLEF